MKRILATAFLLTAAGVATSSFAQSQAGTSYVFFGNPVNAALHFDGAEHTLFPYTTLFRDRKSVV